MAPFYNTGNFKICRVRVFNKLLHASMFDLVFLVDRRSDCLRLPFNLTVAIRTKQRKRERYRSPTRSFVKLIIPFYCISWKFADLPFSAAFPEQHQESATTKSTINQNTRTIAGGAFRINVATAVERGTVVRVMEREARWSIYSIQANGRSRMTRPNTVMYKQIV